MMDILNKTIAGIVLFLGMVVIFQKIALRFGERTRARKKYEKEQRREQERMRILGS